MAVNRGVVVGAVGIVAVESVNAIRAGKGITRIAVGGYVLAVLGALVDLVPGAGPLAGSLVMAAFVGVLLSSLGGITALLNQATGTSGSPGAGDNPAGAPQEGH